VVLLKSTDDAGGYAGELLPLKVIVPPRKKRLMPSRPQKGPTALSRKEPHSPKMKTVAHPQGKGPTPFVHLPKITL
jgi:hypothetical protein